MNTVHSQRLLCRWLSLVIVTAAVAIPSARAQDRSDAGGDGTLTGTVASSTRNTLVVRSGGGQYQLFVYERNATKPASLPAGTQVRVTSTAGDEPGVRVASDVTVLQAAPAAGAPGAGAGGTATPAAIPPEVRRVERDIERQVRRYQVGVRAGVALDPELILIGVHAQVGPFFNSNLYFRPNVEFAYGEVTALFGLNPEVVYRLPIASREGRWSTYFGVGPGFNFLHQNFTSNAGGKRIDFGEFHSDTGLNILGGMRYRNGMFLELKTSVYSDPAPTLRMIVGYNF